MTVFYGAQMTKLRNTTPVELPHVADVGGKLKVFHETVTYATQTTSDTIEVARLPKGARFQYGVLNTDTSSGTATIAIGISGSTAKYKAAAAFTATDTPTLFGKSVPTGVALAAEEIVFITIGTASLPASGTLHVAIVYTVD